MIVGLHARDLVAGYRHGRHTQPVVEVASLAAPSGQLTAVVGPNGSGKSTLLRTLTGTQPALAGEVLVDGAALHSLDRGERARRIAVVLTDRVEPGLMTTGDVVLLGRHPYTGRWGSLTPADLDVGHDAAARLRIDHLWDQPFAELSDGQRQRALVARALAQQPAVLVLDEPTAFLDIAGRVELTLAVAALADDGLAVVLSTHDLDLALDHADRLWLVAEGTVVEDAPTALTANGELARVFSDEVVEIDASSGSVRARRRHVG